MPLGKRYEVYFPLEFNPEATGDRQRIEGAKFEQTYEELLQEFDGVTVMPPSDNHALSGFWRNKTGQIFEDKIVTAVVYTTDINRADSFFREFRERCKARFQQVERSKIPIYRNERSEIPRIGEEILIISWIVEIME
ncbi:hypothetical protein HYR99_01505 [Candidatus Poribacteria bacterium]|nr:hypothetical protein [Candidatus Poribacteria bacterium]